MKQLIKFPSIEQYRHLVRRVNDRAHWVGRDENEEPVFDRTRPLPTLRFKGTVKIHGTNAGICYDGNEIWCQSKEALIEVGQDNAGFAGYVHGVGHEAIKSLFDRVVPGGDLRRQWQTLAIYGEWCGKGIQKGCAIHKLDKMFVIFSARICEPEASDLQSRWLSDAEIDLLQDESIRFFSINSFPTYDLEIDFQNPHSAKEQLDVLTKAVNDSCPVGKHFDTDGIGEGIVWRCVSLGYESSEYWFKTKGDDHKVASTKSAGVEVDVEKVKTHNEFADVVLSEARLNQGLEHLKQNGHELTERSTGIFIKWVHTDVVKEELDRAQASGIEEKEIGKIISARCRAWYFEQLGE